MSLRQYLRSSRQPRYSVTFAFPLLLAYEGLTALLSGTALAGVRNGADVLLKTVFVAFGGRGGLTAFGIVLMVLGAWIVWTDGRRHPGPLRGPVLVVMLAESLLCAALFGTVAASLTVLLLGGIPLAAPSGGLQASLPLGTQLVISLGAGIYEELVFRVLLVSGLTALGVRIGWRRPVAIGVAVTASALIFSAFHYIGPLGDALTLPSFTFRAIAGLLFSGLYAARGFGIVAWTHALYDVGLALLGKW